MAKHSFFLSFFSPLVPEDLKISSRLKVFAFADIYATELKPWKVRLFWLFDLISHCSEKVEEVFFGVGQTKLVASLHFGFGAGKKSL